jgi:hypothetical protein
MRIINSKLSKSEKLLSRTHYSLLCELKELSQEGLHAWLSHPKQERNILRSCDL